MWNPTHRKRQQTPFGWLAVIIADSADSSSLSACAPAKISLSRSGLAQLPNKYPLAKPESHHSLFSCIGPAAVCLSATGSHLLIGHGFSPASGISRKTDCKCCWSSIGSGRCTLFSLKGFQQRSPACSCCCWMPFWEMNKLLQSRMESRIERRMSNYRLPVRGSTAINHNERHSNTMNVLFWILRTNTTVQF